jgi:glycosyltransferase involved in cell wall biosynthesis
MQKKSKLLVISQALAPSVGGSPIIINNLFSSYVGEVQAISGYPGEINDLSFTPPFYTKYFNPPRLPLIGKYILRYHDYLLKFIHPFIIIKLIREIKRYKPNVIFSHCPNIDYFICAYKASRKCGIPFFSHMHDLWEENHAPNTYIGRMAIKWEETILKNSARVLCMTEAQRLHYKKKYKIEADLLPHTISDNVLNKVSNVFNQTKDKTLLFTGAVSRVMNLDALKVLVETTEYLSDSLNVTLCTPSGHSDFLRMGIDSSNWELKWLSMADVQKAQREASILFAPLSHVNCGIDEVKTVLSTKILEYLISGRPILIFAPKDSFHALSATNDGWALVVDVNDPKLLADEIIRLFNDEELQKKLVDNAYKEAERRRSSVFAEMLYQWVQNY